jgi:hypothetical protein
MEGPRRERKRRETRRRNRKRKEVSSYYYGQRARYEVIARERRTGSPVGKMQARIPGRGNQAVTRPEVMQWPKVVDACANMRHVVVIRLNHTRSI